MDKKGWIIFGVIVVVLFGGLVFLSQKNKINVSKIDTNTLMSGAVYSNGTQKSDSSSDMPINGGVGDHIFGKKDSKVVLVEYGDFQCPYCGQDYPAIKAVAAKYKGEIAFVFRNFPLTTLHPNARAAAAAAEAAGLMGKYWEMHDALYENQDNWSNLSSTERTNEFVKYAKSIGLDEATYRKKLEEASVNQKISFDQALGKKANVTATPTMFLNGTKLDDTVVSDQDKLDTAVKAEIVKQGIKLPKENK